MSTPDPLRGPDFGSFGPEEVAWLLTDLSDVALEAPVEEREEALSTRGAHYAESLPIEYRPDARYLEVYRRALDTTTPRLAHAVGSVTELVLRRRPSEPVLVSLARAGTPIGVLMRRWAAHVHGLDLTHYAISIVRGRGIDTLALRHLADRYDPARIVFVDGWTGKGAIVRELADAVEAYERSTGVRFDPDPAVVADPARCTTLWGTQEDWLIASACLNATVSGLVSRTVLNSTVLRPDQYHGAKFYRELTEDDRSAEFLDTVTAAFPAVREAVLAQRVDRAADHRVPDRAGWAVAQRIADAHGLDDVNLVKPGVGETTRVLLRRVPWRVLVRAGAPAADLAHVRLLAEQRGVEVVEVAGLDYSCVGLIHPRYTRSATGGDGRRAGRRAEPG